MDICNDIVTRPDLLYEGYFPSDVAYREKQIETAACCLEPAKRKIKPVHAWFYGSSGTGKTLTARHILKEYKKRGFLDGIYINCWENDTLFSILDKMVRTLRMLGVEKMNISFKLERFFLFVGKKPFILILDEVDHIRKDEMDAILYNFCSYQNIGLICISKSRQALCTLDERVLSRLNVRQIHFPKYTEKELFQILMKRALFSLRPGSYKENLLYKIAKIADGDARVAIQTLRNAACMAEKENCLAIRPAHVKSGHCSWKDIEKSYLLDRLNSHYRLLYGLVKGRKEINSGELWKAYLERCRKLKKHPIAVRTYSEYMNKLIELELVHWDRALVKGKVRMFTVVE
ncbi:MAG: AAA family ATPase [Candidatus Aminicenantes bacterium]|jgi:Cdc6-like AAA superfamily ATPase